MSDLTFHSFKQVWWIAEKEMVMTSGSEAEYLPKFLHIGVKLKI